MAKPSTFILLLLSLIIIAALGLGIYFYPQMPANMASHWGVSGEVNGYMPKAVGIFMVPGIMILCTLLFIFLPKLDPLKSNVEKFRKYFDWFIVLLNLFFLYLFILTLLWNLGGNFHLGQWMAPGLGGLFFYIGVLIGHSKRNWFIGIRTPWTLSSDVVWDKTHQIGSRLFKASGVLCLFGFTQPNMIFYYILGPVLISALITFVYSYIIFKKWQKDK